MTALEHNQKLLADYMATSKVYSRYPKVSEQLPCLPLDASPLPKFSYNPSIIRAEGDLWMTYRYHFAGDYRTRLGIARVGQDGRIDRVQDLPIEGHSVEDARLFAYHMEPWISWVESKWEGALNSPKSVVKFAKVELPHNDNVMARVWKIGRIYQPDFANNDWSVIQKNWCFFEDGKEKFMCIYRPQPEQIVVNFSGDKAITQWNTKSPRWPYGEIRGGNIVPHDGKLLRFFHSRTNQGIGAVENRYYVGAALMEPEPPFATIAVSRKPILYGSELPGGNGARNWKSNVVYPCGAIKDGDGFILAVGINDSACALVKIKPSQLHL